MGHTRTLLPHLRDAVRPYKVAAGTPWSTQVDDPTRGGVQLTGILHTPTSPAPSRSATNTNTPRVVIVHGLGGCAESYYCRTFAQTLLDNGWGALRLSLRGADRQGTDYYHAGLTEDLHATLSGLPGDSPIFLVGFSLGGHVVLRAALEHLDPRVVAVAAICTPLDLHVACASIDRRGGWFYRRVLLSALRDIYRGVAARGPVPAPIAEVERIRHLYEWDRVVVAPRHGFRSPHDYYRRTSVGPALRDLQLPALLVSAPTDPVVPHAAVASCAGRASEYLDWKVRPGGHVAFPATFDLGTGAALGLESQLVGWLSRFV